uniref:E3 ubiquitin-protein ligase n=1 Tax=Romanomermis culicivorax TaxID=13658 RepID=A0A915J5X1_ROMCU
MRTKKKPRRYEFIVNNKMSNLPLTVECFNVYILNVPKAVTLNTVQASILRILSDSKAFVNVYRISDVALGVELDKKQHVDALLANSNSVYIVDRPYALTSDNILKPFKDGNFILSNKIWLTLERLCRQNSLSITNDLCGDDVKISRDKDDGPWIFKGKTKSLKIFEHKAKEILLFGGLISDICRNSADVDYVYNKLANMKISSGEKRKKPDCSQSSKSTDKCSICLNSLNKSNVALNTTLKCKHMFHTNCINRWLKVTNSCPTCRTMIPPISGDQPTGGTCTLSTLYDKQINGFPDAHGYITIYYTVPNGVQDNSSHSVVSLQ